ncbi:MAG TPA: electron transfer flavoprotein subunit alpha/FixB family protein [Nitrososphaerales archaeon]|nr:electron transfer flavoprotein subunit alpha/FixB family protein [Nitrososphaerales archaeon]
MLEASELTSNGSDVWVFSERKDLVFELLGKGRELADGLGVRLCVVILDAGLQHEADSFVQHGADKVFVIDNPALEGSLPEPSSDAICRLASQSTPQVLLIGSTKKGNDIAARVAARLETGVITNCLNVSLDREARVIVADRPSYGGILTSTETCTTKPQILTIPPRVLEPAATSENRHGEVVRTEMNLEPVKSRVVKTAPKQIKGVKLEDANIVVTVGRGLAKKEDVRIIEELARVLGGEVGCSSPLAEDLKWLPTEQLVGLTGHKVKPKLYFACGISGQAQHITGMRDSHVVVAINNDPEAPIFQQSDYCIIGDMYEVVPALTETFRRILQK